MKTVGVPEANYGRANPDSARGGRQPQSVGPSSMYYQQPEARMDGTTADQGHSHMFGFSKLKVGTNDGRNGIDKESASVYETAFLQCQVQEVIMMTKRKDEELNVKNAQIEDLSRRVRHYLLT